MMPCQAFVLVISWRVYPPSNGRLVYLAGSLFMKKATQQVGARRVVSSPKDPSSLHHRF